MHNTDEIVSEYNYDPTADIDNTPDSVFCSHGAGFIVPWYDAPSYMHLEMRKTLSSDDSPAPSESDRRAIST